MSVYLETSSLVKKYVLERGTDRVLQILRGRAIVAISKIAYAEVYAALSRRVREGTLTATERAAAVRQFEIDWCAFTVVELSDDVLSGIPSLLDRHALRGFDAIHLSTAIWLRSRVPAISEFICSDTALLDAAREAGFRVTDPAAR